MAGGERSVIMKMSTLVGQYVRTYARTYAHAALNIFVRMRKNASRCHNYACAGNEIHEPDCIYSISEELIVMSTCL